MDLNTDYRCSTRIIGVRICGVYFVFVLVFRSLCTISMQSTCSIARCKSYRNFTFAIVKRRHQGTSSRNVIKGRVLDTGYQQTSSFDVTIMKPPPYLCLYLISPFSSQMTFRPIFWWIVPPSVYPSFPATIRSWISVATFATRRNLW